MNKQSPVAHKFAETEYDFRDVNAYRVPYSKNESGKNTPITDGLFLSDFTCFNRAGFRGPDIVHWLKDQHGIDAPGVNQAIYFEQDLLIARLSQTEIMLIEEVSNVKGGFANVVDRAGLDAISETHPEIYYLPRQDSHACFSLCGIDSAQLFSKLCAVDLSIDNFENLNVAQTSLARSSAIIIRRDVAGLPAYNVLIDTSLAEYIWDCLVDAMQEFNGQVLGHDTYTSIEQ